jgi:hypothetical protein
MRGNLNAWKSEKPFQNKMIFVLLKNFTFQISDLQFDHLPTYILNLELLYLIRSSSSGKKTYI